MSREDFVFLKFTNFGKGRWLEKEINLSHQIIPHVKLLCMQAIFLGCMFLITGTKSSMTFFFSIPVNSVYYIKPPPAIVYHQTGYSQSFLLCLLGISITSKVVSCKNGEIVKRIYCFLTAYSKYWSELHSSRSRSDRYAGPAYCYRIQWAVPVTRITGLRPRGDYCLNWLLWSDSSRYRELYSFLFVWLRIFSWDLAE